MMKSLLTNELFWTALIAGGGFLWRAIRGKRAETKLSKATAAIGEAAALMLQFVFTAGPGTTVVSLIVLCRGVAAIRLADAGIYESDIDPLI